jgi:WD40 repeat protein
MSILWKCSHCGQKLSASERSAGRRIHCPNCRVDLTVPTTSDIRALPAPVAVTSRPQPPLPETGAPSASSAAVAAPSQGRGVRLVILASFLLFLTAGGGLACYVFATVLHPSSHPTEPEVVVRSPSDTEVAPVSDPKTEPAQASEPKNNPTKPSLRVASNGNVIVVTDRETGKEVWRRSADAPVMFLAFAAEGKKIISRDEKGETCTWDAANGTLEKTEAAKAEPSEPEKTPVVPTSHPDTPRDPLIPHKSPAEPTGPHSLRVASSGNVIVVTDRLTGKEVWRKTAPAPVIFLAFSPDSKSIISRDEKGGTLTWNAADGTLEKTEAAKTGSGEPEKKRPRSEGPTPKLDSEELRASLLKIKELDFYPVVDKLREDTIDTSLTGTDFARDQQLRQQFLITSPPKFLSEVNGVLLKKAVEEGLPLIPQQYTQLPLEAARTMDALSKELRSKGFVSVPGGGPAAFGVPVRGGLQPTTSANAKVLEDWCKENRIERYSGALNTFLQMLQVEDEPTRMVLVEELGKIDNPNAAGVLAARAVFDLSPDVRKASVESLRKRKPETYRSTLLANLRYPWPTAADHAAEALISLQDKPAIPELVALLDKPDPRLPFYDEKQKTGLVQEVVRINHMRNCFLCHAVSSNASDLVRGAVPRPGRPLPRMYYNTAQADFVQANVTYLRQDFSVAQPVEKASPWPVMQRYDYMVRLRKATDAEMAALRETPSGNYAQRNSVLTALRDLSGRDLGTSTEAWKKYAAELAPAKPPPDTSEPKQDKPEAKPVGPDKEKKDPPPALPEKKKEPMGVTATSPDGTQVARRDGSNIQIIDAKEKQILATIPTPGAVTALAFAPDGKVLFSSGEDQVLTAWSLPRGSQLFRTPLGAVPSSVEVSPDGKAVTCKGARFVVEVDAVSGKQISKGTLSP